MGGKEYLISKITIYLQPTQTPPPVPITTPATPLLMQIMPYIWIFLGIVIFGMFIYLYISSPNPKGIWRKSLIYGMIWSLSYWIIIVNIMSYGMQSMIFKDVLLFISSIIWFPIAIWIHIIPPTGDNFNLMWIYIILGSLTSIFIVYIFLKLLKWG